MTFVYVAINPRQPYYNFYITHSDWLTKCIHCILCRANNMATKFSKQTWVQMNRPSHIPSYVMASASKYNDFCLGICKWTDCPGTHDTATTAFLSRLHQLAMAGLGLPQNIHVLTLKPVNRAQNGHKRSTRSMWWEWIIFLVALRVEIIAFKALSWNDGVLWLYVPVLLW